MLLKNKLNDMKSFLKKDNVLATLEERYCYSKDASNTKIETVLPDLVVFVESIEDVQRVVRYAYEHEIPIIPRGAGTNMVGACVCSEGGIILNFSKMNKVLELNAINMTARVQPGVILGELKSEVDKLGLFYPPDPSNYKVSTIGGSIAQCSAGAMAFKYGTTKDYVLSLKVVTADGELLTLGTETTKNAVGYHLSQLVIGSEGTLAIVVEATLKLIPKPEASSVVIGYFNEIDALVNAIGNILSNNLYPASIDFMDNNSIITVESFANCGLKTEFEYLLLIDLDGTVADINKQEEKVVNILKDSGALYTLNTPDKKESDAIWNARRSSYSASTRLAPDVVSDDIVVPRDKLAQMIKKCKEIANKYSLKVCIIGHAGDGNIHPQFVLNLDDEIEFRNYYSAKSEIYDFAIKLGGTISAEHGIGLDKLPYLENTIDKDCINYMKQIKKMFDRKNILNPGKIFRL